MNDSGPLDGASPMLALALTVRFLLELALLAGVAILAWNLLPGWWRWVGAIGGVVAVATVWGLLLSPKATVAVPKLVALGIEAALFIGVGVGLFLVGFGMPAIVGVIVWVIDKVAIAVLQK